MIKKMLSFILALTLVIMSLTCVNGAEKSADNYEFIRGVDISSYNSLKNSGVIYRDFDGNMLDDDSFFAFLKSNSINCIRIRIWNNPYDNNKNGYGGGNCDIYNACKIASLASKHNIKILADFHLSDFWADPAQQRAPKAWKEYTISQKQSAVFDYIFECLNQLKNSGASIAMVQIGNEINSGLCGETSLKNVSTLLKSGFDAVRKFDGSILRVVHYTDPQKNAFEWIADNLNKYMVDYDVFASSYYSYWHGTPENFTSQLKKVADKYGKYVICAETSYPFTTEDSDFFANNVSGYEDNLMFSVSEQGQSDALRAVFDAVISVGCKGLGVFYWEPAWIAVGTNSYEENYKKWEQYGSGWESSFASEYCDDNAKWHGGSSWDNQALFDKYGNPLEALKVFSEYNILTLGDVDGDGIISVIDATAIQKHIAELIVFVDNQKTAADVDRDGSVTILDATLVQKVVAQLAII